MINQPSPKSIRLVTRTDNHQWAKRLVIWGAGVALLAAAALAATYLSAHQHTLVNPDAPQIQPQAFIVPKSELPISKAPYSREHVASQPSKSALPMSVDGQQTASKNNVTAQLRAVSISGGAAEADVCLQLPSNEDWLPVAQITVAGKTIEADTMQLVGAKNPATYAGNNRCYKFGFPLQAPAESAALNVPVQVTVTRLVKSLPEVRSDPGANTTASAFGEIVEGPWTFTVMIQ